MPQDCKVCSAPTPIRDLVERLRTAGISYRDCAETIKVIRDYDVSHAAIARHETSGHFEVGAVLASQTPIVNPEELTVRTMVDRKIQLYWAAHKDEVPTSSEIRSWLKLMADFAEADAHQQEAKTLRDMFRPALPAGQVIEVKTINEEENGI